MAKVQSDEKRKRDMIREDHERFKSNVAAARSNREFVQQCCADSRMSHVLSRFERDIDEQKEQLITAEKKDIDRLQANVLARRQLLCTLKAAYESELMDATQQLQNFERQNELFIAGAKVNQETGEIAAAGGE